MNMESENTTEPGYITVSALAEAEIDADHADLQVSVRGSSVFFGNAALSKAREVAQFVADLKAVGVTEEDIRLQSVQAETGKGIVSSATYSLRIHCSRLDNLGAILGAIVAQKNASFYGIQWGYSEATERAAEDQLLDNCLARIGEKARRIAAGLGVPLGKVHRCQSQFIDQENPQHNVLFAAPESLAPQRARGLSSAITSPVEMGMVASHQKTVQVRVDVTYGVGVGC